MFYVGSLLRLASASLVIIVRTMTTVTIKTAFWLIFGLFVFSVFWNFNWPAEEFHIKSLIFLFVWKHFSAFFFGRREKNFRSPSLNNHLTI